MTEMDQYEWIMYGVDKGFCTMPVCDFHDGVPMTDEEMEEYDEHGDVCIPVLRLWEQA